MMVEDTGSESDSASSSSRSTFRSDILRSIVAHQCLKIGWHSVSESSLTALTNVLDGYLKRFSQNIAGYAGIAGRTVPSVKDFQVALRDVEPSVQLKDLSSFCANLKDSALEFEINLPGRAEEAPVEPLLNEGPSSSGIVNGEEPSGSSQTSLPLVNGLHDERPEWMDEDLVFPPIDNGGHVKLSEKGAGKSSETKTVCGLADIVIAEDDEDIAIPQQSSTLRQSLPCTSAVSTPRQLKSVSFVNGRFLFPESSVTPMARPPPPPPPPVIKVPIPPELPPKQAKRKKDIPHPESSPAAVEQPPHKKQRIKFTPMEPLPASTVEVVPPPKEELKIRISHPKPEKEKKLQKDKKAPSIDRTHHELPVPPEPPNDIAPVHLPSPPPQNDSHERSHKSVMLKFKKPVPLLVNKKDQNNDERGPEFVEIRNPEIGRRPEKHKKHRRELEVFSVAPEQPVISTEKPKKNLDHAIDRIKKQQREVIQPEEHRNHNHLPQFERISNRPCQNEVEMVSANDQPRKVKKEHRHEKEREREREKERQRLIREENIRRQEAEEFSRRQEAEEFARRQEAEEFARAEQLRIRRQQEAREREEQARRIRAEELMKREQLQYEQAVLPPPREKKAKHRDGKKSGESHRFLQQEYVMQQPQLKMNHREPDRPGSRDQDGNPSRPSSSSRPHSASEKPGKQNPPVNQPPLKVTFKMPPKESATKTSLPPPPPARAPPVSITPPYPYQSVEPRFDPGVAVQHAPPSNPKLSFTPPAYPRMPISAPLDLSMKSPAPPPVAHVPVAPPVSQPSNKHLRLIAPPSTKVPSSKPAKPPKQPSAQYPLSPPVVPVELPPVVSKKKPPETAPVYVPPVLPPVEPPPAPLPSTPPILSGFGEGDKLWICPACSKPDDGSPMVGCDECDDWFHWPCVGLMTEPTVEKWFCPRCTDRKLSKSKKGKKR